MDDTKGSSFLSQMKPLLLLVLVFFSNFMSRIILGPLMPTIELELKVGHDEAGIFFLLISVGYGIMLMGSSFVSSRLNHGRTIILSSVAVGGALLFVGLSHHLWNIRLGFFALGMAAGLYFPSGIATITELVNPRDFGKAIAFHEMAATLGFITAPLLAEALLDYYSWHGVLILFGIASLLCGVLFVFFGKGGTLRSEVPNTGIFRVVLKDSSYWIIVIFFSLGIGNNVGLYSMLPLYLVSERGMVRSLANTLLGLSRIPTLVTTFLAGWFTDRVGPKKALRVIFLATGIVIVLLGSSLDHGLFPSYFFNPCWHPPLFRPYLRQFPG